MPPDLLNKGLYFFADFFLTTGKCFAPEAEFRDTVLHCVLMEMLGSMDNFFNILCC